MALKRKSAKERNQELRVKLIGLIIQIDNRHARGFKHLWHYSKIHKRTIKKLWEKGAKVKKYPIFNIYRITWKHWN